jgi:hypothetical protein
MAMPLNRPLKSPRKLNVPTCKYRLEKTGLGQEWKTSHEMPGALPLRMPISEKINLTLYDPLQTKTV